MPKHISVNTSIVDFLLVVISGILFLLSVVLWYLAFISEWFLLFMIATILLLTAIATLILNFLLIIKSLKLELEKKDQVQILTEPSTTHLSSVSDFAKNSNSILISNNSLAGGISNMPVDRITIVTLSAIEWRIINYLRQFSSEIAQHELVEGCSLSKSTISSNLSSLEQKGIVKRQKKGKTNVVFLINDPKS
ncbi:MAG: winged helix-turn-helix transcriptional regulator [Candidatus Heimdallarchaeota archaeon]|nr:winged helix-turn-helix transcriptional regulator [Candidatus Heimdallarchaeota archaeon]